jgi:uncharacterized protein involved in outer membrane biogenesis
VLAAGAALWAYYSLDVIVKIALEHYGPDVLGVPVKVGNVRISAKSGEGTLRNLEIGTPGGFSAQRAARFGEIRIALDPATVTDRVVVIREIAIDSPIITLERGRQGSNLDAIQKQINAYAKATAPAKDAPGGGDAQPRRFIIERLAIRGAKVTMTNAALKGQGITFDLPDIQMRDIGKLQNGLRASQTAEVVTREIIAKIAQRVLTNIDLLRKGGVEGAVDALKGLFK